MSLPGVKGAKPMMVFRRLCIGLFYLSIASLITACGGPGSDTVANPDLSAVDTGYRGPPSATSDVRAFEVNVWNFLKEKNRCGQCHANGQQPDFVNTGDVNLAYAKAVPLVSFLDPSSSLLVTKVGGGHNCWLTSAPACAASIQNMIINWAGGSSISSARAIQLTPPPIRSPGTSKTFPASATDFENTIHLILKARCQSCHEESASLPISPFFANADPLTAYEAAKSKIDIDTPANSRFVVRLREEFHNCWTNSCQADALAMQTAIENFAGGILPTSIDPFLINSKAVTLSDGIIASGGNRHENNLIAIWEFKTGTGSTAFDTSGIEPAINLSLSGTVGWLSGFGLNFTGTNGKAQGDTFNSKKLHDFIRASGEYSIETWTIPANVTQEDANIVSYSAGFNTTSRNFTLGQKLYNYEFYNRVDDPDPADTVTFLSTEDAGEILQSGLQHVVTSYDPVIGRNVYVNGSLLTLTEPVVGSTSISNWDDSFAFVLGNEVPGNRPWNGQIRMVAIHNRVLTQTQVEQNFDVGVGQKYFLLFSVAERLGIAGSFIMFEVSQFDNYSYLFEKPVFININPDWVPVAIDIEGMRIGINGKEAIAGQVFANMSVSISSSKYQAQTGQSLSSLGTVIALEKGGNSDEFFLSFEKLGIETHAFNDPLPGISASPPPNQLTSDIGIKTFDEINASISAITGIPVTNTAVEAIYDRYLQQFPTVEAINAFLPSHQMAIAQLVLTSCSELVEADQLRPINDTGRYFPGFDFNSSAATAFDDASKRDQILDPLLAAVMNVDRLDSTNNLTSQPDETEIKNILSATATQDLDPALSGDSFESLITEMTSCGVACDTIARTEQTVKAVCAATVGGAVMLIQ
jgi:hypothetical protein